MAKSSINIQPSSGNAIIHNERIFDVAYALKNDDVNEYHRIASISETRKAIYEDYKLHHGRKLNTKATPIREAVVNLNENHTMEDLKKLSEMLDKDYQMKVLHIAIHRDEGHIDKTGEEKINYHAHIVFSNYDFDKHITIKRDKDVMRKLQTDVANCLGMERGEENSQKVRLDHRQYKRAMQEVEEKTKELQRELKEVKQENTELKYSFKEMQKTITSLENLTAEQKRELHSLNSKVKNEKAEYEELLKKLDDLKQEKAPKTNEIVLDDKSIPEKEKEVLGSLKDDFQSELEANKKGLLGKSYEVKLKEEFSHSPNVESLTLFMRVKKKLTNAYDIIKAQAIKILNLETENKSLKKENDKLSRELREAELEIKELSKEEFKHYPLNSEKKDIATTPKAQSLEEILKSPVKKEAEAKENNPTYDIEAKAYKPKVKEESQIRKQGRGIG
jgi:hypothetical protein